MRLKNEHYGNRVQRTSDDDEEKNKKKSENNAMNFSYCTRKITPTNAGFKGQGRGRA